MRFGAISTRPPIVGMARWPCLTLLLLASAPTGHAGELHKISKQFRSAYSGGSDVDVQNLLIATEAFCKLLSRFGRFVSPSIANVRMCIGKVDSARKHHRSTSKKVKELLKSEIDEHKPGGVLADPSAAMGLLWMRRGLEFWAVVFEQQVALLGGKNHKFAKASLVALGRGDQEKQPASIVCRGVH